MMKSRCKRSLLFLFFYSFFPLYGSPSPLLIDLFSTANFADSSTAANTFLDITSSSIVNFLDTSTAANALITVDSTSTLNFEDASSAASAQINLSGTLNFNQSGTDIFNGQITGSSGSVNKTGSGSLTFNGDNSTYSGALNVDNGTLFLNGAFGGNVTVAPAAKIVYKGPISGNLNVDNGIITTDGITTLQVLGNYTQTSAATYIVNVSTQGSSLIDVGGTATIAGFVQVNVVDGLLIQHPYTILHANGGVTGTYTLSGISSPLFSPFLSYDPNNVFLTFSQNIAAAAATPNQAHVAAELDTLTSPTADEAVILSSLALLSVAEAQNALDQMSGEQYTLFIPSTLYGDYRFERRLYNAYRELIDPCCCHSCDEIETWVSGGGGQSVQKGNTNAAGGRSSYGDFSLGLQSFVRRDLLLGIAAGYENDHLHFNLPGTATLQTVQGALYAAFQPGNIYWLADLIGGWSWSDWKRPIVFGDINRKAEGKPHITHGRVNLEVGFNYLCGTHFLLQPYLSGSCMVAHQNHITEKGAQSLNLDIESETKWMGSTQLGLHLNKNMIKNIRVDLDLAWEHDFNNSRIDETTQFIDFGSSFPIIGPSRGHDGALGALYLSTPLFCRWEIYGEVSGEAWKNWHSYEVSGGVIYRW